MSAWSQLHCYPEADEKVQDEYKRYHNHRMILYCHCHHDLALNMTIEISL